MTFEDEVAKLEDPYEEGPTKHHSMLSDDGNLPENSTNEGQPPSGVFVYVVETEIGRRVEVRLMGGFDSMAVPSLMELAYKVARAKLGLDV